MRLSAPIFALKRKARLLSRTENIPLYQALNIISKIEGYSSWSLLIADSKNSSSASNIYRKLEPGDLLLLGARKGHGKTSLALQLLSEAIKSGENSLMFSLDFTNNEVSNVLKNLGLSDLEYDRQFSFDSSDDIYSRHIIERISSLPKNSTVVIDYLQLLDQKRENPSLADQMHELRNYASEKGTKFIVLSQIRRSFEETSKSIPDINDVRLPNPINLSVFHKTCFVNNGKINVD